LLRDARTAANAAVSASPGRVGGEQRFRRTVQLVTGAIGGLQEAERSPVYDFITAFVFSKLANIGWFVQ